LAQWRSLCCLLPAGGRPVAARRRLLPAAPFQSFWPARVGTAGGVEESRAGWDCWAECGLLCFYVGPLISSHRPILFRPAAGFKHQQERASPSLPTIHPPPPSLPHRLLPPPPASRRLFPRRCARRLVGLEPHSLLGLGTPSPQPP
jgi:hypothetical protein